MALKHVLDSQNHRVKMHNFRARTAYNAHPLDKNCFDDVVDLNEFSPN